MRLDLTLLALLTIAGCAGDALSADSYMDEDHPPYGCDSEPTGPCGSSSDAGPNGGSCQGGLDCANGEFCAASFDGDIGQFECQSACIESMDDTRWCYDSSACCNATDTCTRGYCIPAEDTPADSSGGSSDASTSSSTTDGGSSSSSSGSGSESSSGGSSSGG